MSTEDSIRLPDFLSEARQKANKKQNAIARVLKLTPQLISQWENGKSVPS